ncbi:acylphosphatase [Candidatus Curtissbacteria bacterium RBG_16_39_7]|uniref:acylphosphatase n=1 Tax=Candidatus Curtissbacteria bacterium RBG_16_39_7 TaxID=1797707 RepID=A0A1F5G4B2_9BACT|nr:MAG: acylphosphatase [Candidatus Curtissbacteria bacterium RBG_16_39_7]
MVGEVRNLKSVHVLISGRVQGVFFRSRTKDEAQKLGLVGWVVNTPNGGVEIVAEGEKEKLEKFINWCKKGSLFAKVENVEVTWEDATGGFDDFQIHY